jgi:hypothetical protein
MNRLALPLLLSVLASLFCVADGAAIMPATPEQMICGREYIFIGKAIEATPVRTPTGASFSSGNRIDLTIVVERVLGTKAPEASSRRSFPVLSPGDTVKATTYARSFPYSSAGRFNDQGGLLFTGPYDSVIPDEILIKAYTDESFIYSGSSFTPTIRMSVSEWPLGKEDWVKKTMAMYAKHGLPCSSPL